MIELFYKGGPLMYPLLVCSLISCTLIIERMLFWQRRQASHQDQDIDLALKVIGEGDLKKAQDRIAQPSDAVLRIIAAELEHDDPALRERLEVVAAEEMRSMKRFTSVFETVITISPLIGILGTITGIIGSFDGLGSMAVADASVVSSGIAEALITTASGLCIAIVTVVPHNYFQAQIDGERERMEKYLTMFEIEFKKGQSGENS
jgi:biopolymer transport protein ExbB